MLCISLPLLGMHFSSKVPEHLRAVDIAESEYIASIMALNGYNTEFQPEMEGKLKQFQVNACGAGCTCTVAQYPLFECVTRSSIMRIGEENSY